MKNLEKDYYTVEGAADVIGISFRALHQRIYRKSVAVYRPYKRVVLVPKTEVDRLKKEMEAAK